MKAKILTISLVLLAVVLAGCLEVFVDVKPQSCPNPLNVKSKGVIPVAILGLPGADVNQVDPASVMLEGVAPLRWSYEDVATPTYDTNECVCTTEGPDGYTDLVFKFDTQEIVTAIGDVNDGDVIPLTLTGALLDKRELSGKDCVVIHKPDKP